ncbi:MAG TPA: SAM-dependent methyltransferase [Tepidisphaeraceae bacterium]|nr:SAM-dependent methyltransferase [Tepidisphaeraceae bacterium]
MTALPGDLNERELMILETLYKSERAKKESLQFDELVAAVDASVKNLTNRSTMSQTVQQLFDDSKNKLPRYVEKDFNPHNQRQPLIKLTGAGREIAKRIESDSNCIAAELTAAAQKFVTRPQSLWDGLVQVLCDGNLGDPCRAVSSRICNYLLGGDCYLPIDRLATEALLSEFNDRNEEPRLFYQRAVEVHRAFVKKACVYAATNEKISQFLDLGAGFPEPTEKGRNIFELVKDLVKHPVVVPVDKEPAVVREWNRIRNANKVLREARIGDVLKIEDILDSDIGIDFGKPVTVVLCAVLHFVQDDAEAKAIIKKLRDKLAPGSLLIISHGFTWEPREDTLAGSARAIKSYKRFTSVGAKLRSIDVVRSWFSDMEPLMGGLLETSKWLKIFAPDSTVKPLKRDENSLAYGGVFRIRPF